MHKIYKPIVSPPSRTYFTAEDIVTLLNFISLLKQEGLWIQQKNVNKESDVG